MQVDMHEAKTRLSPLVALACRGEEVYLARNGTPVARIVPIGKGRGKRALGTARGMAGIQDEFYRPMTDAEYEEFLGR